MQQNYSEILDIKARQRAFLDDTAAFYNLNNRATKPRKGLREVCVYGPTEVSPGCAIGRHIPKDSGFNFGEIGSINYILISTSAINKEAVPLWMKEMGKEFLSKVQDLHDYSEKWSPNGLSKDGENEVEKIKLEFDL